MPLEHDEQRDRRAPRARTAPARIAPNGLAAAGRDVADVVGQRHRQRLHGLLLGDQERPEELVPRADEGQQHGGEQGRPDQRQRDRPAGSRARRPRRSGPRRTVLRQLQEVLPEDEHRGRVDRERQDHARGRCRPGRSCGRSARRAGSISSWNGTTCTSSTSGEQRAAAAELQHGERVAGEHPEDHRAQQHAAGEDARVDQRLQQVDARRRSAA